MRWHYTDMSLVLEIILINQISFNMGYIFFYWDNYVNVVVNVTGMSFIKIDIINF